MSVGSGNGIFTKLLERSLFGSLKTFKKHTMLHDVFIKFYSDFEERPDNNYASPAWFLTSQAICETNFWTKAELKN